MATDHLRGVVSIDPGTRNLALCHISYRPPHDGKPLLRMIDFLACCRLTQLSFISLGTTHIDTATVEFAKQVRSGGKLEWLWSKERNYDIVIERQGSLSSPVVFLCHAIQGFFLGLQNDYGTTSTTTTTTTTTTRNSHIYLNYPAANKFRGDWVTVPPNPHRGRVLLEDPYHPATDPVKRAAVEACERVLSYFSHRDELEEVFVDRVQAEKRQHDMADCILQGVSYLFKFHVQKLGSSTQRAKPSLTLSVDNPTDRTEQLLGQPREGRKRQKQTTAKRSAANKRTLVQADDEAENENDPFGD